jgi:5-methylcytosine-specific restriction endonuclease McrA
VIPALRTCLLNPIPEIEEAARYLDDAVIAHLAGQFELAKSMLRRADMPALRERWTEPLWGRSHKLSTLAEDLPVIAKYEQRMPSPKDERQLLERDGHHCRFCGIPVIRKEVRDRIKKVYPGELRWGRKNTEQHTAFQAMWLQYDHLVPHARGGNNALANLVITCAPCNFARMNDTLEEVGLLDPRDREPVRSTWDGLERFY